MSLTETSARKARTQASCILPTYSADTFGVCSALFELGGMVVIHDPSGCNSTYTTHDEPRWYHTDSLVFISAMNEYDAILGRDDRLLHDLIETVRAERPRFLCLIPSQIAYLIATDLKAIAREVEHATGVPSFTLPTNSMHDAERGISLALTELARRIPPAAAPASAPTHRLRVNVLGVTPLDFPLAGTRRSLARFLEAAGGTLHSCWALGTSYEEIARAAEADVSLVMTYGGLGAARVLKERFGIPYLLGQPLGALRAPLADALQEAAAHRLPSGSLLPTADALAVTPPTGYSTAIIGESIGSLSLAAALRAEDGRHCRLIVPVAHERALLPPDALAFPSETALTALLAEARPTLLADPMYRAVSPPHLPFVPLPHTACSGRIYEAQQRDLLDPAAFATLIRDLHAKERNRP